MPSYRQCDENMVMIVATVPEKNASGNLFFFKISIIKKKS